MKPKQKFFRKYFYHILSMCLIFFLVVFIICYYEFFVPVSDFPINQTFTIQSEDAGGTIFTNLQSQGYIRNTASIKILAKVLRKNKFYGGEYTFASPASTFEILSQISKRPVSLAVLIPEGFTKEQIADRLAKYIMHFNRADFLGKAKEGYLFPDTYYFYAFSTNDEILQEFNNKFNQNTLENFGRLPTKDEVIIASMLEREAKDPQDMKIISGIIQNRLKIGMALQIDSTVLYGKGAWQDRVFYRDLKKDSDYNTYLNPGLPIGPISNPGLNAISAAMNPAKTDYFYYLTGKDGKMYYAKTAEEHIKNKIKYLR